MEAPNKLMIMQTLGCFGYDSMILKGLMRIFSGASCAIHGVLGKIGVIQYSGRRHGLPDQEHRDKSRSRTSGQVSIK